MMPRPRLILALAVIAAVGFGGCAYEEISERGTPRIAVVPGTLVFEWPEHGVDHQELLIRNEGDENLRISSARIDAWNFAVATEIGWDFEIPPQESATITIEFRPYRVFGVEAPEGGEELVLHHNDELVGRQTRIPLVMATAPPELYVGPDPIDFGRVRTLDPQELPTRLTNIGGSSVTVHDYFIVGGNNTFSITDGVPFTDVVTLAPNESHVLSIVYEPVDDMYRRAQLVIESSAPNTDNGRTLVEISANGGNPCLHVRPGTTGFFDLGDQPVGLADVRTFTVRNCSVGEEALPVHVSSIELSEDSSTAYSLSELPSFPLELHPDESAQFKLLLTPPEVGLVETATLLVRSNDQYSAELEIELAGTGVEAEE